MFPSGDASFRFSVQETLANTAIIADTGAAAFRRMCKFLFINSFSVNFISGCKDILIIEQIQNPAESEKTVRIVKTVLRIVKTVLRIVKSWLTPVDSPFPFLYFSRKIAAHGSKVSLDVPDETIFCIFVELNRFDRELKDCRSVTEQWLYSLKRVGTLDRIPDELKSEMFERLFRACEIARFDKEQKLKYESDMITERDEKNIINTAIRLGKDQWFAEGLAEGKATGKAEGLAEGKAKGRAEERIAIAGTLKLQGFPVATIAAATGMTEGEIEAL